MLVLSQSSRGEVKTNLNALILELLTFVSDESDIIPYLLGKME